MQNKLIIEELAKFRVVDASINHLFNYSVIQPFNNS